QEIARNRKSAQSDARRKRTADDGFEKSPALIGGGGRASAARFAPGAGAKHNAAGNATTDTTDPHAIAQRHASFYAPADTNPDADTEGRFIGNVPRQSAADGAHARAGERGQFSFPKGSTSTSVAPACNVGVSTRASTRANGWEHFEAGSFIGKRRRHTAWPLREEGLRLNWKALVRAL